ncbi:MAG: hypothetical protein HKN85_03675, partial [Gammaproteobacteria bacterium]|nr:hypothetical protein [Gammaproteobacteria bacterium]
MPAPETAPDPDSRLDASSGIENEACASIWTCVADALSDRIGEATFERWFAHVSLDGIDSEV